MTSSYIIGKKHDEMLAKLDPEWAAEVLHDIEAQQQKERKLGEFYLPHISDIDQKTEETF